MKVKINGKVYKTIVRPAMVYGADTWAVKEAHEKKMVAEMKMLRWMCSVTRFQRRSKNARCDDTGMRERRDCQERRCSTELHGGDYRPMSTTRRSGIKTEKKCRIYRRVIDTALQLVSKKPSLSASYTLTYIN